MFRRQKFGQFHECEFRGRWHKLFTQGSNLAPSRREVEGRYGGFPT